MVSPKVWIDGKVVAGASAKVPVFDRGFLHGDSVFEALRTFGGRPHALGEHVERLFASARRIGLSPPPRASIEKAISAVLAALGVEAYLRVMVTRGQGQLGLDPALAGEPRLVVIGMPLPPRDEALYAKGVEVAIVRERRNVEGGVDPLVKSGNYLASVLAVAEARRRGAYEAVLCDGDGRIAECSSSNIFVVAEGRVRTPPLSVGLLDGITRRWVLRIARGQGLAVEEVPLWPADLAGADEAFLTSSVRGVVPVVRVDGRAIGSGRPGAVTARLASAYESECAGG